MDLSAFIPGQEMVNFQTNSSLAKSLIDLFQEAINYRESLDLSVALDAVEKGNVEIPKWLSNPTEENIQSIYKVDKMFEYCNSKEFFDKIKTILKKEVNIDLTHMQVTGGYGAFIQIDPHCNLILDAGVYEEYDTITNRVFGTQSTLNDNKNADQDILALFENASNIIDRETSKLLHHEFSNDKFKITLKYGLGIDSNTLFCLTDYFYGIENLTAEEIAAIYLHEIGHAITFWELLGNQYAVGRQMRHGESISKPLLKNTVEQIDGIQKFVNDQATATKKKILQIGTPKDIKLLEDRLDKTNRLITIIKKLKSKSQDASVGNEALVLGAAVIGGLLTVLAWALTWAVFHWFLGFKEYDTALHGYVTGSTNGIKNSEVRATKNNLFTQERLSDEFAVRHGLGGAYISGMIKVDKAIEKIYADAWKPFVWESEARGMEAYTGFVRKFCPSAYFDSVTYENRTERLVRIIEDIQAVFNSPMYKTLPAEIKKQYVLTIETARREIAAAKTYFDSPAAKLISKIFRNLNPTTWIRMVVDGNIDEDFAKLQNQIDALDRNSINFWAEKIRMK